MGYCLGYLPILSTFCWIFLDSWIVQLGKWNQDSEQLKRPLETEKSGFRVGGSFDRRNPRVGDDFFVARKVRFLEIQVIDGKRGKSAKHGFFKDAEKQVNDFFQPTIFWSPKSMLKDVWPNWQPHVEPAYWMVLCV